MNSRLLFLGPILCCTLFSCTETVYQVSSMKSNNVDSTFTFENGDLKLEYDFWTIGGKLDFTVTNKTEKAVFIDWENSNFIFNGYTYEYFSNEEIINTSTVYVGKSLAGLVDLDKNPRTITPGVAKASKTRSESTAVVTKEKKYTQLPPNAFIRSKTIGLRFPWLKMQEEKINFDPSDSPLKVRTYLAYSHTKSLEELSYIDNEFYLSEVVKQNVTVFNDNQDLYEVKNFYTKALEKDNRSSLLITLGVFIFFAGIIISVLRSASSN